MVQNSLTNKINVLGVGGSLRKNSYNRALLRAAQELAPADMEIRIFENETLSKIPLYNEDVRQQGEPEAVEILKNEINRADALLFAIPEYNHSVTGVLKNAIDWASRPASDSPLNGKPVALIGASIGMGGTVRAQMHFRQICVFTNMHPVNKPEVLVGNAQQRFDSDGGKLIDEDSRKFLRQLLEALLGWTRRLNYGEMMVEIGDQTIPAREN
jgi:chromate reductase, NAD(P)H dehydrogenase (quinone)